MKRFFSILNKKECHQSLSLVCFGACLMVPALNYRKIKVLCLNFLTSGQKSKVKVMWHRWHNIY